MAPELTKAKPTKNRWVWTTWCGRACLKKFEQFIGDIHYEYGVTDGTSTALPSLYGRKTAMIRSTVGMAEAFCQELWL